MRRLIVTSGLLHFIVWAACSLGAASLTSAARLSGSGRQTFHLLTAVDQYRLMLETETAITSDRYKSWAWTWQNMLGMVLAYAVGSLGNAVGIGGGAFFVPLGQVLLGFSLKGATALSQAIITGGAVASVLLALAARHPVYPAKPLIDFGTALMLTPVLLLGVSIGVLLNVLFPDWLLTFLLTALLLWLTLRIVHKARRLFLAENTAREAAASDAGLEMQDAATTGVAGGGAAPPDSSEEGRPPRGPPGDRSWHGRPEGPRRRAVPRPGSAGQTSDQSRSHPVAVPILKQDL